MTAKTMIETQLRPRGVRDDRVLAAVEKVPRDLFVPRHYQNYAYQDSPLPLSEGQTISQPYIVATMTERLCLPPHANVLEIGTGSGYQTAILAELAARVHTIEIIEKLARTARKRLVSLGYQNIHYRIGDGHLGWPEASPFDAIIATAAPVTVPDDLIAQLRVGGRLVIPVGASPVTQQLMVIEKTATKQFRSETVMAVCFVPMVSSFHVS